ncbi:MAG: T9SS type A sorting domain-containing protein [Chitinophagales bacterium]|nr:T9SS type A sorting domain-containing protein [Chitinophagales bacterium]
MKTIQKIIAVFLLLLACAQLRAQVVAAEYFIDTDPGQGNGIAVQAADGNFNNVLEGLIRNGISVSSGFHKIGVRVKDFRGSWGPVFTTVISVETQRSTRQISVNMAEYFWDNDPGQGNGTAMVAFDGNFNAALETALASSVNAPSLGKHKLNVRVKDINGNWGPVFATVVNVENPLVVRSVRVIAGECFFDTDPGQGNGTALIAFDGAFDEAIETVINTSAIAAPSLGRHKFNVRVRDPLGNWGPLFTTVIFTENPFVARSIRVMAGECFFGNDPGQGNGTPLIAFDGNFNDAIEKLMDNGGLATPSTLGRHKFNVRAKDALGNWGPLFTTIISVENILVPRDIKVVLGEYFFDTDPGQGNANVMFAFDGNFNNALETATQAALSSTLSTGFHKLSARVKDVNGNWGPVFTTVLFIDPCTTTPTVTATANGNTTLCLGDSVQLTASGSFSSYTWVRGVTVVGTTQSIYVRDAGFYTVIVRDGNNCPGTSNQIQVQVIASPTVSISGNSNLCPGGSTLLTANASSSGLNYQWYRNNTPIGGAVGSSYSATLTGDYTVRVTNGGSCGSTSPSFTVVNATAPTASITAGGPTSFCPGAAVDLTANSGSGLSYQWYSNGQFIVGASQRTYTASYAASFTVVVTNTSGCTATSNAISVSLYPLPSAAYTASGPTTFCQGDSVRFTASSTGLTYSWLNSGIATGNTSNSILLTQNGSYSLSVTDANGCTATSSATAVTVNLPPSANITATGPTSFCAGGSVVLNANTGNGLSYQWKLDGNVIGFANGNSYTASASGNYTVVVYSNGNCFKESNPVSVTVLPAAPASISHARPLSFCQGDSVVLKAPQGAGLTYQWTFNGNNAGTKDSLVAYQAGTYGLTVNNSNNCPSNAGTVTVVVSQSPTVAISAQGPTRFCQGASVLLEATATGTNLSYAWYNGASYLGSNTNISVGAPGSYRVIVTAVGSCSDTSNTISVTVDTLPTVTLSASGNTTFCSGDSVTLSAQYQGALTLRWYHNGNLIAGATANTLTVDSAGSYYVEVRNSNQCLGTSNSIGISVLASPSSTVTASGPLAFCQGGNVALSVPSAVGNSYQWFENGNRLNVVGNTLQADTSGVYTVEIENSIGCNSSSIPVVVTVWPLPIAVAYSADSTFCLGNTLTLNAVTTPGAVYQWYKDGAFTGTYDSSYVTGLGGNYHVIVTDSNGCIDTSDILPISANPSPPALISSVGPVAVCTGDSVVMIVNGGQSHTGLVYEWQKDGFPLGVNDTTYTTSVPGLYNVEVTNTFNCTATTATITVLIDNPPTATISALGATTFCSGDSVQLVAGTQGGWTYRWRLNGNYITGATDSVYFATQSGNYSVDVFANAGCVATSSVIPVTVYPAAMPLLLSLTPTTFCDGDSAQLFIVNANVDWEYQWYYNNQLLPNDTLEYLMVYQSGDYDVAVIDDNSCPDRTSVISITVKPVPTVSLAAGGATSFCQGGEVELNAISDSNYTYLWTLDGDTLLGANDSMLLVNSTGNYSVIVTDTNACSSIAQAVAVTVYPLPNPNFVAQGNTEFCNRESVLLTANPDTSLSYSWYVDGNPIQPTVTDSFYLAETEGAYSVVVTDQFGCSDSSSAINITIYSLPAIPVITVDTNRLTASQANAYQWYRNDTLIPGAIGQSYNATEDGVYSVLVTNAQGCSTLSDTLHFVYTGIEDLPGAMAISIYPNPNHGEFSIEFSGNTAGEYIIDIVNAIGQQVFTEEVQWNGGILRKQYSMPLLAEGLYWVNVRFAEGTVSKRLFIYH